MAFFITTTMKKKIAIIGGGNLGTAIAEGLIESKYTSAENITITRRNIIALNSLSAIGVHVTADNRQAVANSDIIIFTVKPFQVKEVMAGLADILDEKKHIVVSAVTGIFIEEIQQVLQKKLPLFRAMPNTAIAIRESITCISYTNAGVAEVEEIVQLFQQLGLVVIIDEKLMDAATVLGACGTAYAMRYIRANIQGGIEIGFDAKTASIVAAQTVKGAAELLLKKQTHPEQEIDKVTTPKGCTIAGLNEMEHRGFSSSLIRGVLASYKKIVNG
jgi:pyrroline-5-carboxylate reductase